MVEDYMKEYYAKEAARKAKAQSDGPRLLKALKKAKQTETIRIEFSGSGDSGGIDSIEGIEEKNPLYKEIDEWADEFAGSLPCDWVNNEGGGGWIELDAKEQKIRYSVSVNEMSTSLVESGEFGIDGEVHPLPEEDD